MLLASFHRLALTLAAGCLLPAAHGATFLFDATKAEMAGNADWVIDADAHNLKVSAAADGSGTTGTGGNESNPQRFPTPDQTNIVASTSETYWEGALSAWAIDLVKNGQHVETLPCTNRITWRDGSNVQDLTNYNVFVLVEPNIYFTAAEKTALVSFVQNGGSLFIVSDHSVADRNNDGSDAYQVLNDLMTNSVQNNPFGIHFNGDNISVTSTTYDTNADDLITHGTAGTPTSFAYHNGSTISINPNQNPTARIAFWSSSTRGTNNALIAYASYGTGKVVAIGDSSPFDDGTGDPNDTLIVDYTLTSVGDGKAILNASLWLAQTPARIVVPTPTLRLQLRPGAVQVTWPTNATGFILQTTTNLAVTNSWVSLTNGAGILATNYIFTNGTAGDSRYYRLTKP